MLIRHRAARSNLITLAVISVIGCFVWALPVMAVAAETLDQQFTRFVALWSGNYDNLAQADAQIAAQGTARNAPTRLFVRKVDLPAFGDHAFYAEWQSADGSDRVTRQRIYGLHIDRNRNALRLSLHIWPADNPAFVARTSGAYADPAKLGGVTPAHMMPLPGCDVYFMAAADGFVGAMDKGACAFPAPDGTPIYSWSQMKIVDGVFSYLDGWFKIDGTPYRQFSEDWYVFERR